MNRREEVRQPAQPGCMHPRQVTQQGMNVGLVQHQERVHPVAQALGSHLRVIGEPEGRVAVGPAAPLLQRLRQVPMVEAHPRRYTRSHQAVEESVVEIEASRRQAPAPGWHEPRPRERQAVRTYPQPREQGNVFLVALVMPGGYVATATVDDVAGHVAEAVPDRFALAARGGRALDLVSGG